MEGSVRTFGGADFSALGAIVIEADLVNLSDGWV